MCKLGSRDPGFVHGNVFPEFIPAQNFEQFGDCLVGDQVYAMGGDVVENPLEGSVRSYRETDRDVGVDNDPNQRSFRNDPNRSS